MIKKVLLQAKQPSLDRNFCLIQDSSQPPLRRVIFSLKNISSSKTSDHSIAPVDSTNLAEENTKSAAQQLKNPCWDLETEDKSFKPRLPPSFLSLAQTTDPAKFGSQISAHAPKSTSKQASKSPAAQTPLTKAQTPKAPLPTLPITLLSQLLVGTGTPKQSMRDGIRKIFGKYTLDQESRKLLWKNKIGNHLRLNHRNVEWVEELLKSRPIPHKELKVIVSDLDRTFPECDTREEGKKMYRDMLHILCMFACYRPDIGYVQGMSALVLTLYPLFGVQQTFVLFANLLTGCPLLRRLYTMDTGYINKYTGLFAALLKDDCPKLCAALEKRGVSPDIFVYEWLFTLGARAFSQEAVRQIWDVLFSLGEYYMLSLGVVCISLCEKELLAAPQACDVGSYVRRIVSTVDIGRIIKKLIETSVGLKKFNKMLEKIGKKKESIGGAEEPSSEDD